jgi:undecaprenyl-diphosphatase
LNLKARNPLVALLVGALLVAGSLPLLRVSSPLHSDNIVLEVVSASASFPLVLLYSLVLIGVRRSRLDCRSIGLLVSLLLGGLLVWSVKSSLKLERPPLSQDSIISSLIGADQYSYPSGHTLAATTIVYYLWKRELSIILLAWLSLVGFSRVILGAHYVGDVIAGLGFGLIVSSLVDMLVVRRCEGLA